MPMSGPSRSARASSSASLFDVSLMLRLHASTVAINARAVVICGKSGAGKSALALELLALGATLVADDITELTVENVRLIATCPQSIRGRIEARGVGILKADDAGPTPVALVVDLDASESERLPPFRSMTLAGVQLPCLHNPAHGHFPAAILQYMRAGRSD